jgi:hypothetical protein
VKDTLRPLSRDYIYFFFADVSTLFPIQHNDQDISTEKLPIVLHTKGFIILLVVIFLMLVFLVGFQLMLMRYKNRKKQNSDNAQVQLLSPTDRNNRNVPEFNEVITLEETPEDINTKYNISD